MHFAVTWECPNNNNTLALRTRAREDLINYQYVLRSEDISNNISRRRNRKNLSRFHKLKKAKAKLKNKQEKKNKRQTCIDTYIKRKIITDEGSGSKINKNNQHNTNVMGKIKTTKFDEIMSMK